MISHHLLAERERLLSNIQQISSGGEVAPPYCWLTTTSSVKRGKTYTYIVLILQKPDSKPKSQSLGRSGSSRHRHWQTAIARREAIAELEQQLSMLELLILRQANHNETISRVNQSLQE